MINFEKQNQNSNGDCLATVLVKLLINNRRCYFSFVYKQLSSLHKSLVSFAVLGVSCLNMKTYVLKHKRQFDGINI